MKSSGTGRSRAIAQTTPPLAVPSSLVSTSPVSLSASSNALTCAIAFWPVLASSTSSTSCGASGCALAATRFTLRISSIRWSCVGSRPAVSAMTTSVPRARRGERVVDHGAGIAARLRDDGNPVALAPDDQLLARRCAERVAGGEQHALALRVEPLRELADRGRLARAVDPCNHQHVGLRAAHLESFLQR